MRETDDLCVHVVRSRCGISRDAICLRISVIDGTENRIAEIIRGLRSMFPTRREARAWRGSRPALRIREWKMSAATLAIIAPGGASTVFVRDREATRTRRWLESPSPDRARFPPGAHRILRLCARGDVHSALESRWPLDSPITTFRTRYNDGLDWP